LRYIRQERQYRYAGLNICVPTGVFHPGIFFSTPIFLHFLKQVDFHNKTVLDVGTGSGILAVFAAKNGGQVTAIDLHLQALATAQLNATNNGLTITTKQSDLFAQLTPQLFDFILVNPPYYPRIPKNDAEKAFFAGHELEYFDHFFSKLPDFIHPETKIWMILSEDCDLKRIAQKALGNSFSSESVFTQKKWGEIFEVIRFKSLKATAPS